MEFLLMGALRVSKPGGEVEVEPVVKASEDTINAGHGTKEMVGWYNSEHELLGMLPSERWGPGQGLWGLADSFPSRAFLVVNICVIIFLFLSFALKIASKVWGKLSGQSRTVRAIAGDYAPGQPSIPFRGALKQAVEKPFRGAPRQASDDLADVGSKGARQPAGGKDKKGQKVVQRDTKKAWAGTKSHK